MTVPCMTLPPPRSPEQHVYHMIWDLDGGRFNFTYALSPRPEYSQHPPRPGAVLRRRTITGHTACTKGKGDLCRDSGPRGEKRALQKDSAPRTVPRSRWRDQNTSSRCIKDYTCNAKLPTPRAKNPTVQIRMRRHASTVIPDRGRQASIQHARFGCGGTPLRTTWTEEASLN